MEDPNNTTTVEMAIDIMNFVREMEPLFQRKHQWRARTQMTLNLFDLLKKYQMKAHMEVIEQKS